MTICDSKLLKSPKETGRREKNGAIWRVGSQVVEVLMPQDKMGPLTDGNLFGMSCEGHSCCFFSIERKNN